jgi:hypothetical protein
MLETFYCYELYLYGAQVSYTTSALTHSDARGGLCVCATNKENLEMRLGLKGMTEDGLCWDKR